MHEGNVVKVEVWIMHEPKAGRIIQPRLLLHRPSAISKPVMHKTGGIYSIQVLL